MPFTFERLSALGARLSTLERSVINLIASDNAKPKRMLPYEGEMIQEGIIGDRPFAGAGIHDEIEAFASGLAREVFAAEHANLQPHSCSQANQAVYHALLSPGDVVLSLSFEAGGHLTHGLKSNFSGRLYAFNRFGSGADGRIDYDELERLAKQQAPRLIVCGSSAHPRLFDVERLRCIADDVGAKLMLDLSHEAGLIAGGAIPNVIPLADVVTMSLDKTLRGPFGGAILCRGDIAKAIDKAVHPGTQSSFPIRKLTDAAAALLETRHPAFRHYAKTTLANAKAIAAVFSASGHRVISGGTDKHYAIVDVSGFGLSGVEAEVRLESVGILTSRQTLPWDKSRKMSEAGGIRLGAAWMTSRGYEPNEAGVVADLILKVLSGAPPDIANAARSVNALAATPRPNDVWSPVTTRAPQVDKETLQA